MINIIEDYINSYDGVPLYLRCVVPEGVKSCPIVFSRTPYEDVSKGTLDADAYKDDSFIKNGYARVIGHCRGTGNSGGVCVPYKNERDDGLRCLEYIRTLPFYNGEIYIAGGSYLSTVHLSYLAECPDDIKGAALDIQTDRMYFRNYRNGMNYNLCNIDWWARMMKRQYPNARISEAHRRPYRDAAKRVFGEEVPEFTESLMNDKYNSFWSNDPRTDAVTRLKIPILLTEGWYDFYIDGMFSMWERLPQEIKKKSAFVVGPWGHDTKVHSDAEYPLDNGNIPSDYAVKWFNSIRCGSAYEYAEVGKVNYYSIGADRWIVGDYPEGKSEKKKFFFTKENTMVPCVPHSGSITYEYDPEKRSFDFRCGNIYKITKPDISDGVISFETESFEEQTEIFGKVRFSLSVSSDCDDTAFFARIYLVENGESYNLTETIGAISYFYEDYSAGKRVTIELLTPPIAFTVKRGAKLRADISSYGGLYTPHSNTKEHFAVAEKCKIANTTLHIGDSFVEIVK